MKYKVIAFLVFLGLMHRVEADPANFKQYGPQNLTKGVTRDTCSMFVGDTSNSSALANAQLGPQKRICFVPFSATVVEITVAADAGTPSVTVARNRAGTVANLTSSALATAANGGIACSNANGGTGLDGATTCSNTIQNTGLNPGDFIELNAGSGSTAKAMSINVTFERTGP